MFNWLKKLFRKLLEPDEVPIQRRHKGRNRVYRRF